MNRLHDTDDLEQLLRDALNAHAAAIEPSPAPLAPQLRSTSARAEHRRQQRRLRPFAVAASIVLLAAAVGGVWWANDARRDPASVVNEPHPTPIPATEPEAGTWTVPSSSPLSPRQFPEVMWTGDVFIVWGGVIGNTGLVDGAIYDPSTDAWRAMAPAPSEVRPGASAVWAGTMMVVASRRVAHAYDPATDTWSPLGDFDALADTTDDADAVELTDVVWTGTELLGIGVRRDDSGTAATLTAWRFDGSTWRRSGSVRADAGLPAVRSSTTIDQSSVHDPVALPDGFALWDGQLDGWRFTIDSGWQRLPNLDQYDAADVLVSEGRLAAVDGRLVVVAWGQTATTHDLRIARLDGGDWTEWTVVSDRAVLGPRVMAAGERIVVFGFSTFGMAPFSIDPTTGTATVMDGYPIDTVIDRGAAWSGSQLLVFGGQVPTRGGAEQTTGDVGTVSAAAALWTPARSADPG